LTTENLFRFGLPLLAIVSIVWLTLWLARFRDRRLRMQRAARARDAERDAADVLERAGFAVVGRQVRRRFSVFADGEELGIELIADYVVQKAGLSWVAEVKSGKLAPDLRYAPTRRQLLEYREAFDVDGVLLVDAETRRIHAVSFGRARTARPSWRGPLSGFVLGALAGLVLALSWLDRRASGNTPGLEKVDGRSHLDYATSH
jgi:hypothetical protein